MAQLTTLRHFGRELKLGLLLSAAIAILITLAWMSVAVVGARHLRPIALTQLACISTLTITVSLCVACGSGEAVLRATRAATMFRFVVRALAVAIAGAAIHRVLYEFGDGRETFGSFVRYLARSPRSSPVGALVPFVIPALFFVVRRVLDDGKDRVR